MTPEKRTSQTDFLHFRFSLIRKALNYFLRGFYIPAHVVHFFLQRMDNALLVAINPFFLSHCNPVLMPNRVNWPKSGKNGLVFLNVFMKSEPSHKVATLFSIKAISRHFIFVIINTHNLKIS